MKKVLKTILIILLLLAVGAGVLIHITMHRPNLVKVEDYLYTVDCGHISYELADKLLSLVDADVEVSCSSVRKDNLHARNFDWYYSEEAEFVVRCTASGMRYVSSCLWS